MAALRISFIVLIALLRRSTGTGACPDFSIVHPTTAQPLSCEIHDSCLLATCQTNASDLLGVPSSLAAALDSITIELRPGCSAPVHLSLGGTLPELDGIRVQGLGPVLMQSAGIQLQVPHWILTPNTLQFGLEALFSGFDPHPLLNTTVKFNQAELCPTDSDNAIDIRKGTQSKTTPTSSTTTHPTQPPSTEVPLTLLGQTACEVMQAISRSQSDMCEVSLASCRSMQCSLHQIRVTMTVLPCGGTPGVNINAYHLLEQVTLLHQDFTSSQSKEVRFFGGETILFHLNVTVQQSSTVPDQITFMLEIIFPWNGAHVLFPRALIPLGCESEEPSLATDVQTSFIQSDNFVYFTATASIGVLAAVLTLIAAVTACCVVRRRRMPAIHFTKTDFYE